MDADTLTETLLCRPKGQWNQAISAESGAALRAAADHARQMEVRCREVKDFLLKSADDRDLSSRG